MGVYLKLNLDHEITSEKRFFNFYFRSQYVKVRHNLLGIEPGRVMGPSYLKTKRVLNKFIVNYIISLRRIILNF